MSRITRVSLASCLLFSLAVIVRGQCKLPASWTSQILWGYKPQDTTSTDWGIYMFSDNLLTDTTSNTQYSCQKISTAQTLGLTKVLFKRKDIGTNMCFYGKLATTGNTGKVIFYKKSVESTINPPNSLTDCDGQTGIDGSVFKILVKVPLDGWSYNYVFDAIPDGTYLFSVQTENGNAQCVDDKTSTLTKSGNDITVSSTCLSSNNPFSQPLKISDSITGQELGLDGSANSGFVVLNTEKTENSKTYAYRFFIVKYEIENGGLKLVYESKAPDLMPKGYWTENLIPTDRQPVISYLKSTQCSGSTPYCQNGGTCVAGFTSVSCLCTEAYEGDKCENEVNRCIPNPCQNGGTCVRNRTEYTCNCANGFTGVNCEMQDKCQNGPCLNSGSCITYRNSKNVDNFYCTCVTPYTGDTCEDVDPCINTPCLNGGTCYAMFGATSTNDYQCVCPSGSYGKRCENIGAGPCNGDPCLNGGTCQVVGDSFKCSCSPGYTGNTCEVPLGCTETTCKNGGSCSQVGDSFYCDCTSYYSGVYCEEYEDWFIILLVLVILSLIILFILVTVCACYCCCGWRPGSNKTPYESYIDQQNGMSSYGGDQLTYASAYGVPADPAPETVQFNFVPLSQYQGIATTN